MRQYEHEELHALMDNNLSLKEKSDKAHALPRVSSTEHEQGKMQMMEIYAEAVGCRQIGTAKMFVREVFSRLRQGSPKQGMPIDSFLNELSEEYALNKWCHAPAGNNYMCFCDEKEE